MSCFSNIFFIKILPFSTVHAMCLSVCAMIIQMGNTHFQRELSSKRRRFRTDTRSVSWELIPLLSALSRRR